MGNIRFVGIVREKTLPIFQIREEIILDPNKISETHCFWDVRLSWVWDSVT